MPVAAGIYYTENPDKTSLCPPLILIHGAGSSHLCWPVQLRRLPGFRVLALDLPGHGRSDGLALQSVTACSRALVDFLVALDIYQAVLVGHSLGGAVALETARQYPDRVAALGLISSGAFFNVPASLLENITSPYSVGEGIQQLKSLLFGKQTPPLVIAQSLRELEAMRPGVLAGDWLSAADFDLRRQAPEILAPTWIAAGSEDRLIPLAYARFMASALPRAQLQVLPGGSHMVLLEQPEELQAGLSAYLIEALLPKESIPWEISTPAQQKKPIWKKE